MSDPFSAPSSTSGIEWDSLKGALLLVKPHSFEPSIATSYGETSAVRADVIILDGDKKGEEFRDTLVFPKVLQSQIKPSIGGMVLGRLGQGQKKPGQSAPWTLAEANDADKTVGREYLAANTKAPF